MLIDFSYLLFMVQYFNSYLLNCKLLVFMYLTYLGQAWASGRAREGPGSGQAASEKNENKLCKYRIVVNPQNPTYEKSTIQIPRINI